MGAHVDLSLSPNFGSWVISTAKSKYLSSRAKLARRFDLSAVHRTKVVSEVEEDIAIHFPIGGDGANELDIGVRDCGGLVVF